MSRRFGPVGVRGRGRISAASGGSNSLPVANLWAGWEARNATLDVNNEIASVPDLSGNGNTISSSAVAGVGNRATLSADADYKGERVAVFSPAAAGKRLVRATWVQGALDEPFTIYFVSEQDDSGTVRYAFDAGSGGQTEYMYWNAQYLTKGDGATERSVGSTRTPTARCIQMDGVNGATYQNDFRAGQHVFSGTMSLVSTTTGFCIGSTNGAALPFLGRWAAAYVYNVFHTAAQRAAVGRYINQEFGAAFTVVV